MFWTIFSGLTAVLLAPTSTHAAEIQLNTSHIQDQFVKLFYLPPFSSEVTQLVFKVRSIGTPLATGYVGLSPTNYASHLYRHQPMFEATIGDGSKLRNSSYQGTFFATTTQTCLVGGTTCMPTTKHEAFWISWKNNLIQLGNGSDVGQNVFWHANVSQIGYDINYISFAGGLQTNVVWWKFYDVQPLGLADNSSLVGSRQFSPKTGDLEKFNDDNTETCMQVSAENAGSFFKLQVFETPPLKIYVAMRNAPSCEDSNIFIYDNSMAECFLENDTMSEGVVECVYRCHDHCSSIITIGFQQSRMGQQAWSICELAELRNKGGRVINLA